MGDVYLDLTVANIEDRTRQKELSFLVDTGASRAWIPKKIAKELGIKKAGTVTLETLAPPARAGVADGRARKFPYGACWFAFDGEVVAGNVVFGPSEMEPLVGTHVLEDFRLVIDMQHHTITRRRAMKAK